MTKFMTQDDQSFDYQVEDAARAAGGQLLGDGRSLEFGSCTAMVTIAKSNPYARKLTDMVKNRFLIFESSASTYVFISNKFHTGNGIEEVVKAALSILRIDIEFDSSLGNQFHCGRFTAPGSGSDQKLSLIALLEIIHAMDCGLVEKLFGHHRIGEFEFTLKTVLKTKKDKSVEICPPIWVDPILVDVANQDEMNVRINFWCRNGNSVEIKSELMTKVVAMDRKALPQLMNRVLPEVIEEKAVSELVRCLVQQKSSEPLKKWVKEEGWIYGGRDRGELLGFAHAEQMSVMPNSDSAGYLAKPVKSGFTVKGSLGGWNEMVLRPVKRSWILMGMVQMGLGGMMVDLVPSVSSALFNLCGLAGNGKTLSLGVIASLFGNTAAPGQSVAGRTGRLMIDTFGSTALGLKAQAQQAVGGLLLIDEIGSNDYKDFDQFIYTSANGSSRSRSNSQGELEASPSKTLFMITTGELPISSLVSRNAKEGIFDRAVDIPIGDQPCGDSDEEDDFYKLFQSNRHRQEVIDGICNQYGTVAPAFAKALLNKFEPEAWAEEVQTFKAELMEYLPGLCRRGGADRVVTRFALAGVAGKLALKAGVLDASIVTEKELFEGMVVLALLWKRVRWGHLEIIASAIRNLGRLSDKDSRRTQNIFTHKNNHEGWPTLMASKEWMASLFGEDDEMEKISKRLRLDDLLHGHDVGRNTVGKCPAYYHLRTNWLDGFGFRWCGTSKSFIDAVQE